MTKILISFALYCFMSTFVLSQHVTPKPTNNTDIAGAWILEVDDDQYEPGDATKPEVYRLDILLDGIKLTIRRTSQNKENPKALETVLNIDGSGETNTDPDAKNGFGRTASRTTLENGVVIREINSRSTWEPNEFPARITEQYKLSRKNSKLFVTSVYHPNTTSPVKPVIRKSFALKSVFRKIS